MAEIERDVDRLLELAGDWVETDAPSGTADGAASGVAPEPARSSAPAAARSRLVGLAEAILRWNEMINLVSRKDIGRLVSYHFCDSASALPMVAAAGSCEGRILDVGGSNGLPGLVLAAFMPKAKFTICDARQKRRGFLEEVCGQARASFEIDRVDSEGFVGRHRDGFDLIVARAVTQMKLLARWCLPLLRPGGTLIAYKGSRCSEEVEQAEGEIFGRGGVLAAVVASPWAETCNPLRLFAIAGKR